MMKQDILRGLEVIKETVQIAIDSNHFGDSDAEKINDWVEDIENNVERLHEQKENLEQKVSKLKEENDSSEAELESFRDDSTILSDVFPVENLHDDMKLKIIARLFKNCSLDEMEKIEGVVKETHANYIDLTPEELNF